MTQKDTGLEFLDDYLTVGRAAKALHKSRWSIYRWIESGKIIAVRHGGITFIHQSEIERLNNE